MTTVRAFVALLALASLVDGVQHKCFACFGTCVRDAALNATVCDCTDDTICHGKHCFSKLDIWPDENLMTIQKGCRDEAPGGQEGCQYLGSDSSIACYCTGDHCNTVGHFKQYAITPLPLIECCECDYKKHACRSGDCSHTCQGNYCLMDFEQSRQSCGFGYPQLWTFMRSQHFARYEEDEATCLSYSVGHKRPVHGCTCTTKGGCNTMTLMKAADNVRNDSTKDTAKTHFCYNLAASDNDHPLNASVFKQATQCKGQFCYITLQSAEVGLDYDQNQYYYDDLVDEAAPSDYGQNGPRAADYQLEYGGSQYKASQSAHHTIEAGCMSVGDVQYGKVQLGCYTEHQTDTSMPLVRHCVCASHMCNYYYAVAEEDEHFLPPSREVLHTTSTLTTVPPRRTTLVTQSTTLKTTTTPRTTTTRSTTTTTRATTRSTSTRPPSTTRWRQPELFTRRPPLPGRPGKSSGHSIRPVEIELPDMGNVPRTYSDTHFGRVTASVVPASVFYSTTRPWMSATAPPRRPTPPSYETPPPWHRPADDHTFNRNILPHNWPTKELPTRPPTRPPPPAYRFPTIISRGPRLRAPLLLGVVITLVCILR